MGVIITALDIVAVLSALVIAHELGHFLVAKWCGMNVEDFSLFFGPRLLRIGKFNGTEYNIRTIPLGGYVKISGMEPDDLVLGAAVMRPSLAHGKPVVMHGLSEDDLANLNADNIGDRVRAIVESALAEGERKRLSPEGREELKMLLVSKNINEEEHKYIEAIVKADAYEPDPQGYNQKPLWQRAVTIVAGPFMSLAFGLLLFIVMGFTTGLPLLTQAGVENIIEAIPDNSVPAYKAGLRAGDRIVQINETPIRDGDAMVATIRNSGGKPLTLRVERNNSTLTVVVTPVLNTMTDIENGKQVTRRLWQIGIVPHHVLIFKKYSPINAVKRGTELFVQNMLMIRSTIFSKDVGKHTSGIIGIGKQINDDSKAGISNLLLTAASLSLSLGVLNLFPIPVLDGGQLLLLAWEGIRRRKLTSREVMTAQLCGLSIIAVLFILVTCKDFIQEILPQLVKHG
jgi:regulator of sigma E protease